ncbi:MAG TPA: hypothetical protein VF100_01405 [Thermoanaerobaculia bacterium]
MTKRIGFALGARWTAVALAAVALAGCPQREEPPEDPLAVTTTSEDFRTAARNFDEPCNLSAEFGRCGCTLDGFRTPCDLVAQCLQLGFCEVAAEKGGGTRVTTESATFRSAAEHLRPVCRHSAEFGRCTCVLDGIETSCSLVQRCLELGFCVAVAG